MISVPGKGDVAPEGADCDDDDDEDEEEGGTEEGGAIKKKKKRKPKKKKNKVAGTKLPVGRYVCFYCSPFFAQSCTPVHTYAVS